MASSSEGRAPLSRPGTGVSSERSLLHGLAVFARSGRSDALNFAARKSRLQNVGGHRVNLSAEARADQRVKLVDKHN